MLLCEVSNNRDNNFTLVRLLAALAVIASHSFSIVAGNRGGHEPLYEALGVTPGSLALDVFFVVSGFLVTRSLTEKKSVMAFLAARALRIFPGLFGCVAVVALIIGPIFTTAPRERYFAGVAEYVYRNMQMLRMPYPFGELPGVTITNGPLWSLPVEVSLYVILVSVWLIFKRRPLSTLRIAVILTASICASVAAIRYSQAAGFHLLWMFTSGVLFFSFRNRVHLYISIGTVCLVALLLSASSRSVFNAILLLVGPYLVFCFIYLPSGYIRNFNRFGDYSYGVYIYGYPSQFVFMSVLPLLTPWQLTALASPLALTLAALSWHLVEKRSLRSVNLVVSLAERLKSCIRARSAIR